MTDNFSRLDYFAGQALAGLLANDDAIQRIIDSPQGNQPVHAPDSFKIAAFCFMLARTMIRQSECKS